MPVTTSCYIFGLGDPYKPLFATGFHIPSRIENWWLGFFTSLYHGIRHHCSPPFREYFLSFFPTTVSNRKSKKLMKMANPPEIQVGEVKTEFRPVETGQFDHKSIIGFPPNTKNVKPRPALKVILNVVGDAYNLKQLQPLHICHFDILQFINYTSKNLYIYQWHTPPKNWRQH